MISASNQGGTSATIDYNSADNESVCGAIKIGGKNSTDFEWCYDVVVIGDVFFDEDFDININDVICLRKEIVGIKEFAVMTSSTGGTKNQIQEDASDVNNSNLSSSGERQLGDIGDVIAIRQRILSKKWADITN